MEADMPELQVEETPTINQDTPTGPIEPVQSAPQGVPEKCYPIRNRHSPNTWLIFLLSDLLGY